MFKLSVVTPEKKVLVDTEVDEVVVPAFSGELTLLPGHAPLMTTLGVGKLRYKISGSSQADPLVISWGYCEVFPNGVTILAETAETKEEIDRERAEIALKKSKEKLVEASLQPDQIVKFQRKMARARARLELLDKA